MGPQNPVDMDELEAHEHVIDKFKKASNYKHGLGSNPGTGYREPSQPGKGVSELAGNISSRNISGQLECASVWENSTKAYSPVSHTLGCPPRGMT
jgi:hypothetical protein